MNIKSIAMRGIKSANSEQELTGRDIIVGHNGAGKTTRAQALGIALLGHVPGGGKLPAETMKLAHGDSMSVGLTTDAFILTRTFERKGTKIEQCVTLNPPNGEKTAAAKEERIERELGKVPVMLDFNEFLNLSDMKRREFIYTLAGGNGGGENAGGKQLTGKVLRERLQLSDAADPEQIDIVEADIIECLEQYADDAEIQAGLQTMLDYAKEQTAFWKKEREKAVGASQKIAEYKNELAETDRSLDANNARLEELQKELQQLVGEQAKANSENLRREECNARLTTLRAEIAEIEASSNTGCAAELRELITQYSADIRYVDHSAEIAAETQRMEAAQGRIAELEEAVEQRRNEYHATEAKRTASETLFFKLLHHSGTCPIDCRIECDKNFSNLMNELAVEMDNGSVALKEISRKEKEARANLEAAKKTIQETQNAINTLRSEETSVLRENEQIQAIIREYEAEIAQTESFDATKDARITAKREELAELMPEGGSEWPLIDTAQLIEQEKSLREAAALLKAKIAEQTKARNTLTNLQSSMVDSTVAGYHADAWKNIADAVGPKGLQGELVKDVLAPLTEAIQNKLRQMGIDKSFYFQTEDDKGKEVFQFGWEENGERRNFDALSTGEQMLLLIAMMTTIIERLNPPLKALVIDNAENLDGGNLRRVLSGIQAAGENLDNIIFLGVMDIDPKDAPGWHVWDLSVDAA